MTTATGTKLILYQVSQAPPGTTCQHTLCCGAATVRLRKSPSGEPADFCDMDFNIARSKLVALGQRIVDTTGDLPAVEAEFGNSWNVWRSRPAGRIYATTTMPSGQGMTVDDFLAGPLRTKMLEAEKTKAAQR